MSKKINRKRAHVYFALSSVISSAWTAMISVFKPGTLILVAVWVAIFILSFTIMAVCSMSD